MTGDPERLAYFILKSVNEALREFDMLREGDRVAVAVSGGKDSLSLLRLLQMHCRSSEKRYTVAAIHVRGDATGVTQPHLPLEEWLAGQDAPYRWSSRSWPGTMSCRSPASVAPGCGARRFSRRPTRLGCNVVAYARSRR